MLAIGFVLIVLVVILANTIKILREWERGVVLRLGKFQAVRGPGITFLIPGIERMYRLNTRVITVDVPPQDVITKDNVTLKVTAVVFFHIISPRVRTLESGEKGGRYHDWTGSFDTTYSVWRSLLRERLAFPEGITVPIVRTGNTVDRGHK